tara:strand:- start:201 stop:431 length:231 start_codon:yes stop_codon:yes gene_type:complete
MMWMILFVMGTADPFTPHTLQFETHQACVDYVNNPANSDRLAIEVIDQAGFNDELVAVLCLHESEVHKRTKKESNT